jgi:hypothetical protein
MPQIKKNTITIWIFIHNCLTCQNTITKLYIEKKLENPINIE